MYSLVRKSIEARKKLTAAKNALWPSVPLDKASTLLLFEEGPCADPEFLADTPRELYDMYKNLCAASDTAYVRRFDGLVSIDPRAGLLFERGRVIWRSTDLPGRERTPLFLRHIRERTPDFKAVALLLHIFDNNYFHFFNNIVQKVPLFERAAVPADIPLVVSRRLAQQRFFRDACAMGLFGGREIVVQETRRAIVAGTVYVAIPFWFQRPQWLDWALDRLGCPAAPRGDRRLFIQRGPRSPNRRFIRNQAEVDRLLADYDIEKVDPQAHSLAEQVEIFSSARLLVGAHGAGLTNMLFRRDSPLDVIELFNPTLRNMDYYLIARRRGYRYRPILNRNVRGKENKASAEVDITALEQAIRDADAR